MTTSAQTSPFTMLELADALSLQPTNGRGRILCALMKDERDMIVAALRAAPPATGDVRRATIEECAKFIERHQERITETSNGSERSVSPRMAGNQMGLAYAESIRDLIEYHSKLIAISALPSREPSPTESTGE